jgi:hypothetical protein
VSWQAELNSRASEELARRASEPPPWVVTATDPPTFSKVWALRYTKEMSDAGESVAEDLSLMATSYERHISASFQTCADGIHVLCEFLPPVESICVRPERMTGVVRALQRSGYHARCSDGHGKSYEF